MKLKNKKRFSEMSTRDMMVMLMVLGASVFIAITIMSFIIYLYLAILQFSLKSYPLAISLWSDLIVHTEKLNSIPYMVHMFFLILVILGYPFVFSYSALRCMICICKRKKIYFELSFLYPCIFSFGFLLLSAIGHVFI